MSGQVVFWGYFMMETNLVLLLFLFNLIRCAQQRIRMARIGMMAGLVLLEYLFLQVIVYHVEKEIETSVAWSCVLQMFFTLMAVGITIQVNREERTQLSMASIKNGVDNLAVGICCYWPGGSVKLVNAKMKELGQKVLDIPLTDGKAFWDQISRLDIRDCTQAEEKSAEAKLERDKDAKEVRWKNRGATKERLEIDKDVKDEAWVEMDKGEVYRFRRYERMLGEHVLYEVIATDISHEYDLHMQLCEKQAKADEINRRLRRLNTSIDEMVVEREIMTAKSRLHDEFGRMLVMTRQFILRPDAGGEEELRKVWKRNTRLLRGEKRMLEKSAYREILHSVKMLGLEVSVDGEFPQDERYQEMIILAISTCATNVLRHAKGTKLMIMCNVREDGWRMSFTNDGERPKAPIVEGGGLTNLRQVVRDCGCRMEIADTPQYRLSIYC
ncbi:MAG: hypothetical protein IJ794_16705 [Lachnospiraceae bacterium]|nr:hypothetical protein [Lachnospiraceae bacterium]